MPETRSLRRPERKRRWDRDNMLRSNMPTGGTGRHYPVPEATKAEMRRMRADGASVREIMLATGLAYCTCSRITKGLADAA